MAISKLNEKWAALIELAAQEQSIIASVTSGLYAPDATGTKVVHMRSIGSPSINVYDPAGADISYSDLTDAELDLDLNIYKEFHFKVEDVHQAAYNTSIDMPALVQAGGGLALAADASAFALHASATTKIAGNAGAVLELNAGNIEDYLFEAKEALDEYNADARRFMVLPPSLVTKVVQAKLLGTAVDANEAYTNGFVGKVAGFDIFQSNQLAGAKSTGFYPIAATYRAIPFAAVLNQTESFRLQGKFATAYRGLYAYGVAVRHPNEMVRLFAKPVANS